MLKGVTSVNITEVVQRIQSDLDYLVQQFATPSAELFSEHHEAIEQLEQAFHAKTLLDAAFTYSAMAADALGSPDL